MQILKALWAYRGFISSSVAREFQAKYRNTLLGAAWSVLNPLAMIVVYTLIFSEVMRTRLSGVEGNLAYSIYLCSGIFAWGLFSEITLRAQNTFLENANLLKKVNFPRLCLPVVVILNALVNFLIVFGLFALFLLLTDNFPGWVFLGIVPLLVILIAMAIGLGITLGVLNVFFRDIGQFFGIVIQFWFWLTPIVYPANILPAQMQRFIELNPMSPLMEGFQTLLLLRQWPHLASLAYPALTALLLCWAGMRLFREHAAEMTDEL